MRRACVRMHLSLCCVCYFFSLPEGICYLPFSTGQVHSFRAPLVTWKPSRQCFVPIAFRGQAAIDSAYWLQDAALPTSQDARGHTDAPLFSSNNRHGSKFRRAQLTANMAKEY
ncbi:hypothetical protein F5Y08DRAFT_279200 [Xylaria arbuscula]|nr:hypothetical protein F5Y08DRAFT_279200 [Xylaria arbuscula]